MYHYVEKLCAEMRGPQLLLVTHHLEDILAPFSHGLLLKAGSIFKQGPRQEVLSTDTLRAAFDLPEDAVL
jgi:iron complex transport system ATP-binding protein